MSIFTPREMPLPGMPAPPGGGTPDPKRAVTTDTSLHPSASDIQRFASKVVRSPACWFWTGAISTPDGYGRFTFQHANRQRTMLAHRFALLAAGVDLDPEAVAEHACNEPLCVRVDANHVHLSTQTANLRYAVGHGRHNGNLPAVYSRDRAARSLRIRAALKDGWDEKEYRRAIHLPPPGQPPLFPMTSGPDIR